MLAAIVASSLAYLITDQPDYRYYTLDEPHSVHTEDWGATVTVWPATGAPRPHMSLLLRAAHPPRRCSGRVLVLCCRAVLVPRPAAAVML